MKVTPCYHSNNPVIKYKAGLLSLAEELQNILKAFILHFISSFYETLDFLKIRILRCL